MDLRITITENGADSTSATPFSNQILVYCLPSLIRSHSVIIEGTRQQCSMSFPAVHVRPVEGYRHVHRNGAKSIRTRGF